MNTMEFEKLKLYVENNYNIIEFNAGHVKNRGVHSYSFKNPFWRVIDNNEENILMFCEKNTICKLCPTSYQKILDFEKDNNIKITWFMGGNGYITGNNRLMMHQIIMDCYGNGKGTKFISVDHIDRNKINNCYNNLRLATLEEQQNNSKGILQGTKRDRKHNAIHLPHGITQLMIKKYVVYYHEWLDTTHTKEREFFKVEKHPKLKKPWITTKSNKVSIYEKLTQANKIIDDLEKDIYPEPPTSKLPKYISLIITRGKPHLVFEKRLEDKRLNLKMVIPEDYDLEEQLENLCEKVKQKYNIDIHN